MSSVSRSWAELLTAASSEARGRRAAWSWYRWSQGRGERREAPTGARWRQLALGPIVARAPSPTGPDSAHLSDTARRVSGISSHPHLSLSPLTPQPPYANMASRPASSGKVIVFATVTAKPGKADELEKLLQPAIANANSSAEPGTLTYRCARHGGASPPAVLSRRLRDADWTVSCRARAEEFRLFEEYESASAIKHHRASPLSPFQSRCAWLTPSALGKRRNAGGVQEARQVGPRGRRQGRVLPGNSQALDGDGRQRRLVVRRAKISAALCEGGALAGA